MSARFVSTTRLSNVIQMITLARQSGILRVLRGHGSARELGQIRFVDGQPVAVLLSQLTGQAALSVLANWGECVYSFDEGPQVEGFEGDAAWSSGGSSGSGVLPPLPDSPVGSWPSYGYGSSGSSANSPLTPPASYTGGPSVPASGSPSFAGSFPPAGPPPGYAASGFPDASSAPTMRGGDAERPPAARRGAATHYPVRLSPPRQSARPLHQRCCARCRCAPPSRSRWNSSHSTDGSAWCCCSSMDSER